MLGLTGEYDAPPVIRFIARMLAEWTVIVERMVYVADGGYVCQRILHVVSLQKQYLGVPSEHFRPCDIPQCHSRLPR